MDQKGHGKDAETPADHPDQSLSPGNQKAGSRHRSALPLSDGGKVFEPSVDNCLSGDYPLARSLYIYVNDPPSEQVDLVIKEFFRFILSKQGQEIVVKDGYLPLAAKVVEKQLMALK